ALDHDDVTALIADVDWDRYLRVFTANRPSPLVGELPDVKASHRASSVDKPSRLDRLAGLAAPEQHRLLAELVRAEIAAVLGHAGTVPAGVRRTRARRDAGGRDPGHRYHPARPLLLPHGARHLRPAPVRPDRRRTRRPDHLRAHAARLHRRGTPAGDPGRPGGSHRRSRPATGRWRSLRAGRLLVRRDPGPRGRRTAGGARRAPRRRRTPRHLPPPGPDTADARPGPHGRYGRAAGRVGAAG